MESSNVISLDGARRTRRKLPLTKILNELVEDGCITETEKILLLRSFANNDNLKFATASYEEILSQVESDPPLDYSLLRMEALKTENRSAALVSFAQMETILRITDFTKKPGFMCLVNAVIVAELCK